MSDQVPPQRPPGRLRRAGTGTASLVSGAWQGLRDGLRALPAKPLLTVLCLGLVGFVAYQWDLYGKAESRLRDWEPFFSPAAEGLIIVDTPQLFTRERLVNERLRESDWIEKQIEEVDEKLEQKAFARVDGLVLTQSVLAMTTGAGEADALEGADPRTTLELLQTLNSLEPSPLRAFEAARNYRERLALQRYETILDDAHDIGENTLHRLNFRLTIAPARSRTDSLIGVSLRMRQAFDYGNLLEHYSKLMVELRKQLEGLVDKLFIDRALTFDLYRAYRLDLKEEAAIGRLLDDEIRRLETTGGSSEGLVAYLQDHREAMIETSLKVFHAERRAAIRLQLENALNQKQPLGFWSKVVQRLDAGETDAFYEGAIDKIEGNCRRPYGFLELAADGAAAADLIKNLVAEEEPRAATSPPTWTGSPPPGQVAAGATRSDPATAQAKGMAAGPPPGQGRPSTGDLVEASLNEPIVVRCWETVNAATISRLRLIGILHHIPKFANGETFACRRSEALSAAVRIALGADDSPEMTEEGDCAALMLASRRLAARIAATNAEIGLTGLAKMIRDHLSAKQMETTRRSLHLGDFFEFTVANCSVERCSVDVRTKNEHVRQALTGRRLFARQRMDTVAGKLSGNEVTPAVVQEGPAPGEKLDAPPLETAAGPAPELLTGEDERHLVEIGKQEALRLFLELTCFADARSYTVWPRAGERDSTIASETASAAGRFDLAPWLGGEGQLGGRRASESARRHDLDHVFGIGDWGRRPPHAGDTSGTEAERGGGAPEVGNEDLRPCSDALYWVLENYDVAGESNFVKWMDAQTDNGRVAQWWQQIKAHACRRPARPGQSAAELGKAREDCEQRIDLQTLADIAFQRLKIDTHVAWIVSPRSDTPDGPTRHIAMSLPLSAIVSLPSWWGRLEILVSTCWIRPRKLYGRVEPGALCEPAKGKQTHVMQLPLPGRAQDVLQKLGFFILRTPYLDVADRDLESVEAGRPASIRLTGGRLWKNPRVRLGGQWHDRIEVLPDMQGLIATFDCVEPSSNGGKQIARTDVGNLLRFVRSATDRDAAGENRAPSGPPAQQAQRAPPPPPDTFFETRAVQVWTSEGVTAPHAVEVHAFRPRHFLDGSPEQPCWIDSPAEPSMEAPAASSLLEAPPPLSVPPAAGPPDG